MKFATSDLESAGLEELFEAAAADDRLSFLALTDIENLPQAVQETLAADLKKWSELTRKLGSVSGDPVGLRLLALVSPLFPIPNEDSKLGIHYWWARTDTIDNLFVFSELAETAKLDEKSLTDSWWLKGIGQGFCHDDFVLMGLIFERQPRSIPEIEETLAAHPLAEIALDYRDLAAAQSDTQYLKLDERPPIPTNSLFRRLWAEGLLLVKPVSILHPLLMEYEDLAKTVGASQRQVFLPLVDYMQSFLTSAIESYFGPMVWEHYEPDSEYRAAITSEIGHLSFFISNKLPITLDFNEYVKTKAQDFSHLWRFIRNAVSHNQFVYYDELEKAFTEYRTFYDLVTLFRTRGHTC